MAVERLTPVVVGVGDIRNRSAKIEDAIEPLQLMLQAVQLAIKDTGLSFAAADEFQSSIDSILVVATWTWNYADLPGLIGSKLGVQPGHKVLSRHGGDSPAKLFDMAARRISLGESKITLVTGGEALASLAAFAAAKKTPPWPKPESSTTSVTASDVANMGQSIATLHSIGLPIHVYPLYENGLRAHRGQSILDNNTESANLYAEFAKVAEKNPYAWNYLEPTETAETIGTIAKKNRMICFPYTLLMNAFNNINLAGACLLTSAEHAKELGIPETKWIFPLGGAGTSDCKNFWERPNFYSSTAISRSLDAALAISGLTTDEIDLFDFYSCFPIIPKLACQHLGLPILGSPRPITLLGGLTSFGGAGNNYSLHSITAMVRELRKATKAQRRNGLVLANGGMATYQHVVCLSNRPRRDGSVYPIENPLPDVLNGVPVISIDHRAEGEAIIETYTVEFNRDGTPLRGHVVGRLKSTGNRFLANHADMATLQQLSSGLSEQIGRCGWVKTGGNSRNLFSFEKKGKM